MMLQRPKGERPAHPPAADKDFAASVLDGLSRPQKMLPSRFFYDARGSELFEEITRLPEYYPTRIETAILEACAAEIVVGVPDGSVLVEFGSGSSRKTEILLRQLPKLKTYAPIDVSPCALEEARLRLALRFPKLDIYPMVGDFSHLLKLPDSIASRRKTGFFPGSTIGNFLPIEAVRLLSHFRDVLSPAGRLIVGVDLEKDERTLVHAYDDATGITAAFNLNLLARINREIGGGFDLEAFRHRAIYNRRESRIEMHLESTKDQVVQIGDQQFQFRAGESIHTENAYKYSIASFQNLARSANWRPTRVWTDEHAFFSVHELVAS